MSDKVKLGGKRLAEEIRDFLGTQLGEHFLAQLAIHYNDLHHQAEGESLSVEQKAMRIERAAGVKWAIDYLTERKQRLQDGYWDDKK